MLQQRTCRQCGRSFEGGPRAYFCPSCRAERQRIANAKSKARARRGLTRKLGSVDVCELCKKSYNVNGPNQRFCPECQTIHAAEHDRHTAIVFYHENKDRINPVRNERRRIDPTRICLICDSEFDHGGTKSFTCSDKCEREHRNKRHRERYWPKIRHAQRGRAKRIRELRETFGLCPRCRKDWIEPLNIRGWRPKYCRRCQEYQQNYYLETQEDVSK